MAASITSFLRCRFQTGHFCFKNHYNLIFVISRPITSRRCFRVSQIGFSLIETIENSKFSPPWRILFYGSDEYSVINLQQLHEQYVQHRKNAGVLVQKLEVVSGDPVTNPVRLFCKKHNLPVNNWPYEVPHGAYDVGAVASFGALIPERSISAFPLGIINVHPSLLPRWRGAAPIVHSILKGDEMTGVSIMEIVPKKFDVGKILLQKSCVVPTNATTTQMTELLGKMGAEMLLQCLSDVPYYMENGKLQDTKGATLARKIKLEATYVDWANNSTAKVDRMFRAFNDIYYLRTTWHGQHVKLLEMVSLDLIKTLNLNGLAEIQGKRKNLPISVINKSGYVYYHRKRRLICVRCKDGWVGFTRFTVTTKTEMDACQFNNGYVAQVKPDETFFGT